MKIACFSFTESGENLGKKLENIEGYNITHIRNKSIEGGIKSIISQAWENYDGFIFISATGIAIRFIAALIKHKIKDPAVVVIDDLGKFSISLLSGHLGGANKLSKDIAKSIGAIAVITTASDNRGFQSLDMFAKENNYYMEDLKSITKLSSLMVNNKKIGFYSEGKKLLDYPNLVRIRNLYEINKFDLDGIIIISQYKINGNISQILKTSKIPYTILRPKSINIGLGCRKGVAGERIIKAIEEAFISNNLSTNSIKSMGTIEVKKNEKGILQACKSFNTSLKIFSREEIIKVEDKFKKSQFVKDSIGVYSVSEPCAYLLGGEFILKKEKYDGITISITKEDIDG